MRAEYAPCNNRREIIYKVLRMEIFDGRTPTAAEAMKAVVEAVANCRLERTDAGLEDAVLVRIQQVLLACVRCKAGTLLDDRVVCVAFNTCFQVVQQATGRGDLLHRQARLDYERRTNMGSGFWLNNEGVKGSLLYGVLGCRSMALVQIRARL
ncbi:hypothetical protein AMTR_s00017p00208730 [Amborella trichopoda]|uniref:Uncharacterized protein n=1 Tax=Amborella trichopoda TaxID=13333 RepID=W1PLM6_AMBTC|nr:hypothetical protein AMTR_s00017p00208730 [Amborella trichopoda]